SQSTAFCRNPRCCLRQMFPNACRMSRPTNPSHGSRTDMHIIEVDFVGQVLVNGHHLGVRLTRKEAELLRAIMTHSHVATKEFILSSLYGGMDEPELQIIAVFVTKLRKKLGPHRDAILTAWGRGFYRNKDYQLKAPETQQVTVSVEA